MQNAGIIGYGCYIPRYRIKVEEIAKHYGKNAEEIKRGLMLEEKSVPAKDEDSATIAVEAAKNAFKRAEHVAELHKKISAVYVGSESHPYAVKPTATIVAEALGLSNNYTAADTEFACKAGTAALQMAMGLCLSNIAEYALAIGVDTSQAAKGDALEYSAAAGGGAFIIGTKRNEFVAEILHTLSFSTDTPDFWRRSTQLTPKHAGRFTGEPAYFKHVATAAKMIMEKYGYKPEDFNYVIFHQPNGKFPLRVAKKLGFKEEQIKPGFIVPKLGNTYSGNIPLSLNAVLDVAAENELILAVSYGSGAGSDAFIIKTTPLLKEVQSKTTKALQYLNENKIYLSYAEYLQHMEMIH